LPLPKGKLVRISLYKVGSQTQFGDDRIQSLAPLGGHHLEMQPERLLDCASRAEARIERRSWVLVEHLHGASRVAKPPPVEGSDLLAGETDTASRRPDHAQQTAGEPPWYLISLGFFPWRLADTRPMRPRRCLSSGRHPQRSNRHGHAAS
jgi:hypothetical protein